MGLFSCGGKSSVDVVPLEGDVVGDLIPSKGKDGPSTGRMEESDTPPVDNTPGRAGLHSAPSPSQGSAGSAPEQTQAVSQVASRVGLHSAPTERLPVQTGEPHAHQTRPQPPSQTSTGDPNTARLHRPAPELGDFLVEAKGGATAADVDEYLTGALGSKLVKELRAAEWAGRVHGIEALQGIVMKMQASPTTLPADRLALFRACITVLARLLQDKIVPVYLPALQLLVDIYVPSFLAQLPSADAPCDALPLFIGQLVFRAGSSNVRAREESAAAYLHLARCEHVGPSIVCPHALRPLANSKSQHAAVGRLELLRTLVNEFGVSGSTGLDLKQLVSFVVPLCESASEKSRDAAFGLLLAAHGAQPEDTMTFLSEVNSAVAAILRAKVTPDSEEETDKERPLSISGRRLPPMGSMPTAAEAILNEGEELLAHQTPPFADSRARARLTSSELGARSPPKRGTKGGTERKKNRSPQNAANAVRTSQRQRIQSSSPSSEASNTADIDEAQAMLVDARRGRYLFAEDDEALMDEILSAGA